MRYHDKYQPETGTMTTKRNFVVWTMEPGVARDLADSIDESYPNSADLAHRDADALRANADLIDGGEPTR